MNPLLKLFIKLLSIIFLLFIFLQIYNFYCLNFHKCRPFLYSYYHANKHKNEFKDFAVQTNLSLINNNKFIDVITDYDSIRSTIGEIATIKFVFKNLSNSQVAVRSKMVYEYDYFKEYMQVIQCPCSTKIILKPNETKVVKMEYYFHLLVSQKKYIRLLNQNSYVQPTTVKENDKEIAINNIKIFFE